MSIDIKYLDKIKLTKIRENLEINDVRLDQKEKMINDSKYYERTKTWMQQFDEYSNIVDYIVTAIEVFFGFCKCALCDKIQYYKNWEQFTCTGIYSFI